MLQKSLRRLTEDVKREVAAELDGLAKQVFYCTFKRIPAVADFELSCFGVHRDSALPHVWQLSWRL